MRNDRGPGASYHRGTLQEAVSPTRPGPTRHLGQEDAGELDVGVQKRFMDLWEYRLAQGMQDVNASREELGAFGWWFASKKFPDDWSIDHLMTVVEKFRNINPDFAVIKRLAELAPKYPYKAVRCLGIIFEEDKDGWAIHGWDNAPQVIIGEASKGDEKSRGEADRVANLLVARGHHRFKAPLKNPELVFSWSLPVQLGTLRKHSDGKGLGESRHLQH